MRVVGIGALGLVALAVAALAVPLPDQQPGAESNAAPPPRALDAAGARRGLLSGAVTVSVLSASDDGAPPSELELRVADGVEAAAAAREFCEEHGLTSSDNYDSVLRRLVLAIDKERASLLGPEALATVLAVNVRTDLQPDADARAPLAVASMRVDSAGSRSVTVELMEGETPAAAAAAFARRHGLPPADTATLADALARQLAVAGPYSLGTARLTVGGCPVPDGAEGLSEAEAASLPEVRDCAAAAEAGSASAPAFAEVAVRLWSHVPAGVAARRAFASLGLVPLVRSPDASGKAAAEGAAALPSDALWTVESVAATITRLAEEAEAAFADDERTRSEGARAAAAEVASAAAIADAVAAGSPPQAGEAVAGGDAPAGAEGAAGHAGMRRRSAADVLAAVDAQSDDAAAAAGRRKHQHSLAEGGEADGAAELAARLARRGSDPTGASQAEAAAAAVADSGGLAGSGQWVSVSVVVAGQAFDLEYWLGSDGSTPDLVALGAGFCKQEWELLGPLLDSPTGLEQCADTVGSLLSSRAESLMAGVPM
ncbi:hypothetical protein FNF31_01277 [Cafeteria roenbergensis]|uniref:Uncharacterized protein n=1 Tax=Cafeteria roenbergensis TaxID=33653 RepID=A0A5A8DMW9_CAFRO|nr:hypothetical protein FNF31_01277 [Cafeteria roenbergensis]KAA0167334.1 hypothetical protein FNF28_02866 [Cafeteria roenbergensis]|mmetsp:Transcript_9110/g.35639  ORF Transcript_9110/g.35639 Transcript_9110/m.35639 type:complete len:544 (+) Transcript_9110:208-1839(+)